jgi:hypothetical protein
VPHLQQRQRLCGQASAPSRILRIYSHCAAAVPIPPCLQFVFNTTRICVATVSEDCLKIKSSDACVNSMIDKQMEDARQEAAAVQHQPVVLVAAVVSSAGGGEGA